MNNRNRYKRLGLSFPFLHGKAFWYECVDESNQITPVFNLNGYYLDRRTGKTWLEINGEAWYYQSQKSFLYRLKLESAKQNRLDKEVIKAISILSKYRLATKNQVELLSYEQQVHTLRNIFLNARLHGIKIFKKFKEKQGRVNES